MCFTNVPRDLGKPETKPARMKTHGLLMLLLTVVALNSHAEEVGLESVQRVQWKHENYTNAKYGIFVSVKERPVDQRRGDTWGSASFDVIDGDGCKISVSVQDSDRQTVETRVPLNFETIDYLLGAVKEPDYVRFIAASQFTKSALPVEQQVALLRRGTGLREAPLRYYIWYNIRKFEPHAMVADLLPLVLRDPCLDIAHDSLGSIIEEYKLVSADGSQLPWTNRWRGPAAAYYVVQHGEILAVARALRRTRPDFMPEEELKKIRSRAMPSEAWFEMNGGTDSRLRGYFEEYHARVKAE